MSLVVYPIQGVYEKDRPADVSVVVPLYKSKSVVEGQISGWPLENGLSVEVIYVDDRCPQKSGWEVFRQWNLRPDRHRHLVKIVMSDANGGFGAACNLGAYHANGRVLVFLNADTTVTPGWLRPMAEMLEDPSVGVVGNLQVKDGGDLDGTIDGAGSEWSWEHSNFFHVGRHIYHGELLDGPFTPEDAPADLRVPGERDMVTGCCMAVRRDLFNEVGGFDLRYKIGYFEDSELCMTVKEKGYKVMYQPDSRVRHKLSHSGSGEHRHAYDNKARFFNKWVYSGRIDPLVGGRRNLPPTPVSDLLVVRAAAHGDVLVASYVVPALKKKYPDAAVSFLTDPKCVSVLAGHPLIKGVFSTNEPVPGVFQLVCDLDTVYERRPSTNILDAYADEAGVDRADCYPHIECHHFDGLPPNYVVFHSGKTGWAGRNWSSAGFDEVGRHLRSCGLELVTVGRPDDHLVGGSLDLRGRTTVQQLAWAVAGAKFFVGIDSFPMHVAQALNTPGVCFFGSVRPETRLLSGNMFGLTAGVGCLGCHHRKLPPSTVTKVCENNTHACETEFEPARMIEKIRSMGWDRNA